MYHQIQAEDWFFIFIFCVGIGADVYLPVCLWVRAHTRRQTVGQHSQHIKYFVLTQSPHDLWHVQHDVAHQALLLGTNGMWHVLFFSRICLKDHLLGGRLIPQLGKQDYGTYRVLPFSQHCRWMQHADVNTRCIGERASTCIYAIHTKPMFNDMGKKSQGFLVRLWLIEEKHH